jgi:ABC-2 type transport system ATP-binding protein
MIKYKIINYFLTIKRNYSIFLSNYKKFLKYSYTFKFILSIQVSNLVFSYSLDEVLKNIDIEITSNFHGIIGINGAGKSTLLKLCLGLLKPKQGKILFNGISLFENQIEALKQVGVVFEKPVFPPWTHAMDYLVWVGQLRGLTETESIKQATHLLKKLILIDRANDLVKTFSAGMIQRFAIAQALIGYPKILFLDEPTSNLDVKSRRVILNLLKEIANQKKSQIIIMSHILSDLEKFCESVSILHDGKIQYHNTIAHLIETTETKVFSIKTSEIEEVTNRLEVLQVNILKSSSSEIIFEWNDDFAILSEKFKGKWQILPYWSNLEQKYDEITEYFISEFDAFLED